MHEELVEILKRTGALIEHSHIVGTSGRHMSAYVNKDRLLMHPQDASRVGEMFAEKNKDLAVDVVVGPAMGAIILGQWTAFHLSRLLGREVLSVYSDKTPEGGQILKRGYEQVVAGKNILVVEDTTVTAGSVAKVVQAVKAAGGRVLRVCIMVNRGGESVTEDVIGEPFAWLTTLPFESWEASECRLCHEGVPINTSVGHGKKFLESKHIA